MKLEPKEGITDFDRKRQPLRPTRRTNAQKHNFDRSSESQGKKRKDN
jgi:hypothetical protein